MSLLFAVKSVLKIERVEKQAGISLSTTVPLFTRTTSAAFVNGEMVSTGRPRRSHCVSAPKKPTACREETARPAGLEARERQ